MTCLLCNVDGVRLQRDNEEWLATCPRCGRFRFDDGFAALVKHARENGQDDLLRRLTRLAALVRQSPDTFVIRRDSVVGLFDAVPLPPRP